MDVIPARWRALVLGSALAGIVILCFGYLSDSEEAGDDGAEVGPLIVVLLVCAIVGYLLWRNLGSRRQGAAAAGPALVLGILALVVTAFYWTGLVYVLAPMAIALGTEALPDPRGRGGQITGAIALAVAVIGGFVDAVL